jgi:hypothetical protein
MEILQQRPPARIFVQDGVGESEDLISLPGDHRELKVLALVQSASPYLLALGHHIPVEVGVQIGTSIVTSPTVGMEGGDGVRIRGGRIDIHGGA